MVAVQVEEVAGQGHPQVDAGDPGQQRVLEAGSEVWAVGMHRQIGVLGTEKIIQCCGSLLKNWVLTQGRRLGLFPRATGQKVCEGSRACVCK